MGLFKRSPNVRVEADSRKARVYAAPPAGGEERLRYIETAIDQGRVKEALALLTEMPDEGNARTRAHLAIRALIKSRRSDEAITKCHEAITAFGDSVESRVLLAK